MSTKAFVLALLSATPCVGSAEAGEESPRTEAGAVVERGHVTAVSKSLAAHLGLDDSIGDLCGIRLSLASARLLLPWDDRAYDHSCRYRHRLAAPVPQPCRSRRRSRRSIEWSTTRASAERSSTTSTRARRSRRSLRRGHGPVLLPRQAWRSVCDHAPGGGFSYVASLHEGFPYAVEISNRGYNAFVLKYRAGQAARSPPGTWRRRSPTSFETRARRRHRRLFAVGQLGGRPDGRGDRFARVGTVWRLRPAQAIGRGDAVHWPLGSRFHRTSHLRCGW